MASKQFNEVVTFVRNGVSLPAIVLKSSIITEPVPVPGAPASITTDKTTERLTLLYADPVAGPGLINAGKPSAVAATAFNVKPLEPGMVNGWVDNPSGVTVQHIKAITQHLDAIAAVNAEPVVADPTQVVENAHLDKTVELDANGAPIDPTIAETKFYLDNFPVGVGFDYEFTIADRSKVAAKDVKVGDKLWMPAGVATVESVGKTEGLEASAFIRTNFYFAPKVETVQYEDGTIATGVAPLPEVSPVEPEFTQTSGDSGSDLDWTQVGDGTVAP